jgi:hypothetical protein
MLPGVCDVPGVAKRTSLKRSAKLPTLQGTKWPRPTPYMPKPVTPPTFPSSHSRVHCAQAVDTFLVCDISSIPSSQTSHLSFTPFLLPSGHPSRLKPGSCLPNRKFRGTQAEGEFSFGGNDTDRSDYVALLTPQYEL